MSTSDSLEPLLSWVSSSIGQGRRDYSIVRKQTADNTKNSSPILSTGAIIGIAVVGAAALFIGLIFLVIRCARVRHQSKVKPRKVDLEEDDVDPEVHARLNEIAGLKYVPYAARVTSNSLTLGGQRPRAQRNAKPHLPLTPNDFKITGLRDSWPLVSLFPASGIDLSVATAINSDSHLRTMSGSTTNPNQPWPQTPQMKLGRPDAKGPGFRSRSNTSVQPSVSSLRTSPLRSRSMSDNQLSYILRSTSQRLREAQKRPVSRTLSVLSQVSGNPPADKAPSPSKSQNETSHEDSEGEDDGVEIESAKSSVLEMFTGTPSPTKMLRTSTSSGKKKAKTPSISQVYEIEPLSGDTIESNLNSPTKGGVRSGHGQKLRISSEERIMVLEDHEEQLKRASEVSVCERDDFSSRTSSLQLSGYHSFRSTPDIPNTSDSTQSQTERPQFQRQITFSQEVERAATGKQPRVTLGYVSGNSNSTPTEQNIDEGQKEAEENPFQWYKDAAKELQLKHGARRSSSRQGHKRSNVTRMSGHHPQGSVSVVHEESEPVSPPVQPEEFSILSGIQEQNNLYRSPSSVYESRMGSARPPSVATFGSLPNSTSKSPSLKERTTSDAESYSATLSMYNFYTSTDENVPKILAEYDSQSPQSKKSRRHAHHFSILEPTREELSPPAIDSTSPQFRNVLRLSSELQQASFPPSAISSPQRASFPPSTASSTPAPSFLPSNYPTPSENPDCVVKGLNIKPATANLVVSRLHGPRSLPSPIIRDSVQQSISLLRRMNSQVSHDSTADSEGSPALPSYRGGGISPTKHYRRGSSHYLSVGKVGLGMKTLSPSTNRRGRTLRQVGEQHQLRERDRAYERYRDKIRDGLTDKNDEILNEIVDSVNNLTTAIDTENIVSPIRAVPFTGQSYMDSPTYKFQDRTQPVKRWSEVMTPPINRSVRHESQLQMPVPRSPPKMKAWQSRMATQGEENSVSEEISELYDDNGFLRSSPQRGTTRTEQGSGRLL